jgi:hypothetical protein
MSVEKSCDSCGKEVSGELFPCPYQEEANNDPDFRCNCCNECHKECEDWL